jgi:hypothetical protein
MDPSFLDPQMYYGTSAQVMSSYTTLGFYMKPTSTDRTPSTASFDIADLTASGSDVSATIISGGNTNNIRFAFPLYAGLDGWDLNTDDTPQNQVMGGLHAEAVNDAIDLFANADDIDVNMLAIPGLGSGVNGAQINRAIELCDTRGDCFFVADLCKAGTYTTSTSAVVDDAINSKISEVKDQADGYDTSYAAAFFPWVRVKDSDTN